MIGNYSWIRTRDGSLTLWSNLIGEPFRSTRGALTESWRAFVHPALGWALRQKIEGKICVGEMGLGIGTNYFLLKLASEHHQIPLQYYAIERDLESFQMASELWAFQKDQVIDFLAKQKIKIDENVYQKVLEETPQVYSSLQEVPSDEKPVHLWFHDPFGASVNAEAYQDPFLQDCARLWHKKEFAGFSYACNRPFQEALRKLELRVEVLKTESLNMKRERLEFFA